MRRSIGQWSRQLVRVSTIGLFVSIGVILILIPMLNDHPFWYQCLISGLVPIAVLLYVTISLRRDLHQINVGLHDINDLASNSAASKGWKRVDSNRTLFSEHERLLESINRINERASKDIAEMKRLEQVRTEFLGNVSHELRTPIFTVQGFLETLIDGAVDDPEVRDEFLQKAHDNLLRLHTLLNDLIEISRIESGEMKLSFRYFDLYDLCRGTLTNLEANAELNQVHLALECEGETEDDKVSVYGDRKRIEQALVNLLDNAIKYNNPNGSVTLQLTVVDDTVRVSISDTGPGISEEHLSRIFERFYRVDKGRSRDVGGSGLGLSIVKHIIEAHGSKVVVSSAPGEGTTFSFFLPRYD